MSRKIKELVQQELKTHFDGISELIVVSLRGIDGNNNNALRGELLEKQIRLRVVPNSLAARVFEGMGMDTIREVLSGPCAIAYGAENIVDLAKALISWDKKLEHFQIKGGFLEGRALDAAAAKDLAKMPSKQELQGSVVALALSPGGRLVSQIGSPAGSIAGCVKALIEKLEAA